MKWQMPIGVDNFFDIQSKHYYFVDNAAPAVRQDLDAEHAGVFLFY